MNDLDKRCANEKLFAHPTLASLSLDEYPFASTKQGGAGAQVKPVPRSEQNSQGGQIKNFYEKNNIKDGDPFRVQVVE